MDITTRMENRLEKNVECDMATEIVQWFVRIGDI